MSRGLILLIVVVLFIVGALFFLSSSVREVPTRPVEVDVTNAAGH
jgi:hypothetical protein